MNVRTYVDYPLILVSDGSVIIGIQLQFYDLVHHLGLYNVSCNVLFHTLKEINILNFFYLFKIDYLSKLLQFLKVPSLLESKDSASLNWGLPKTKLDRKINFKKKILKIRDRKFKEKNLGKVRYLREAMIFLNFERSSHCSNGDVFKKSIR